MADKKKTKRPADSARQRANARRVPESRRSGSSTGRSTRAVTPPREPNVRFGQAGNSGADSYTLRGKDTEEFGKGNVRNRLHAYEAQGGVLSAHDARTRLPRDEPGPGRLSTESSRKPKGATPKSRYKKGGLVKAKTVAKAPTKKATKPRKK